MIGKESSSERSSSLEKFFFGIDFPGKMWYNGDMRLENLSRKRER